MTELDETCPTLPVRNHGPLVPSDAGLGLHVAMKPGFEKKRPAALPVPEARRGPELAGPVPKSETLTPANLAMMEGDSPAQGVTPVLGPMYRLGKPPAVAVPYRSPGQETVRSSATDFPDFLRDQHLFQKLDPETPTPETHPDFQKLCLETPTDSDRIPERHHKYKTERCKFFARGCCTRGSQCTFAHSGEELRPVEPVSSSPKPSTTMGPEVQAGGLLEGPLTVNLLAALCTLHNSPGQCADLFVNGIKVQEDG